MTMCPAEKHYVQCAGGAHYPCFRTIFAYAKLATPSQSEEARASRNSTKFCCNVGTWFWTFSMALTYEILGHKAPTYRQTEQWRHIQKSDSNGNATRWLRVVLKLFTPSWLQPEGRESGAAAHK